MLVISLLYPWVVLDPVWLFVAPVMVLIGGFLLVGLQSLWLLFRNILTWKRVSKLQVNIQKPTSTAHWLIRSLSVHSEEEHWKRVDVPLIVYFFLVFTLLLITTSVLL